MGELRFDPPGESAAAGLRRDLVAWFDANQRDMPWRRTRDPYAIWISEAMLQQTRVETVMGYWPRFLAAFPDIESLAGADEEAVLEVWSGLGYYRRARSLQVAAKAIVERHGGVFPSDLEDVLALPGIGPYTAGAVLSIALDQPVALVDGNVERVFSRLFLLDGIRSSGPLMRAAWDAARFFMGRSEDGVRPRDWNQAIMELGALVCTPRSPNCGACPVGEFCAAKDADLSEELPRAKPKKAAIEVKLEVYVARRGDDWLLTRRPEGGLMERMWEFPTVEVSGPGLFPGTLEGELDSGLEPDYDLTELRHGITKHRIHARVRAAKFSGGAPGPETMWVPKDDVTSLALTGMAKKVAKALLSRPPTLFED